MSVDKKLLHLRSNQANNYPTGDKTLSGTPIMDYGEIAINYAHDNEFMSIRNSDNKLVLFKPWTFIEQILKDNELVTASALTQIKDSCGFNDYGEYISSNSSHFISEAKSITEALNTLDSQIQLDYDVLTESINELTESVEGSNKVTAAALTRLKESCGFDENGNFNPNIEILNGVESLGSAIEVIANDTQARLKNIQATFDDYAKALTQLKNSCGFNDYGEYHPNSNTIISGCSNITEAIDVLANTANNTVNTLNERIEDIENNRAVCSYVKGGDATYTFDNSLYNVSNNNLTRIIYAVTGLKSGEQITVSFDYEISGIDFSAADSRISIQNHENWGYTGFNFIKTENGSGHHVHTMTVPTNLTITEDTVTTPYILLKYINGNANSVIKISNFKIVKGDKEYKNTVSLPDLNYRIGYNKVTALNGLVATKRMVYCEASASHAYYPHSYDLMPNGEEMHILVKNVHASSNITISFSTNHIRLSGDSITIKPGEYAEINVLRIDQNYYIRAI